MINAKPKSLTVIAASILERAEMHGTELLAEIAKTMEEIDGCLNDLKVDLAIKNKAKRRAKDKGPVEEEIDEIKRLVDRLLTLRHQLQIHLLASSEEP